MITRARPSNVVFRGWVVNPDTSRSGTYYLGNHWPGNFDGCCPWSSHRIGGISDFSAGIPVRRSRRLSLSASCSGASGAAAAGAPVQVRSTHEVITT